MMAIRLLATVALLMAGALLLRAQDYPENPLDGPVMKSDSLEIKPQPLSPALLPFSPLYQMSVVQTLSIPEFETKEQRAVHISIFSGVLPCDE